MKVSELPNNLDNVSLKVKPTFVLRFLLYFYSQWQFYTVGRSEYKDYCKEYRDIIGVI